MAAHSGFSFSRIIDVLGTGRAARQDGSASVSLIVIVDSGASHELACWVRDALVAERTSAAVHVMALPAGLSDAGAICDASIVLVGDNKSGCTQCALRYAHRGVPVALLAMSPLDMPSLPSEELAALVSPLVAQTRPKLESLLSRWLIDATDKPIAFAASFPFLRKPLAHSLVMRCAVENATIGAVDIIHGSDLPLMMANQAKLAFEVSSSYGKDISFDSIADAAAVIAVAYGSRGMWRAVSAAVPSTMSWVVRALLAFLNTQALGLFLIAHCDDRIDQLTERLHDLPYLSGPVKKEAEIPADLKLVPSDEKPRYVSY